MTAVWIALIGVVAFEVWALLTGHQTWSQRIHGAVRGHPVRASLLFGIVLVLAGHIFFGWFFRASRKDVWNETPIEFMPIVVVPLDACTGDNALDCECP